MTNAGTDSDFGDRRMVVSTGPFELAPDSSQTLLFAFPFGQGTDWLHSVAVMRGYASTLQAVARAGFFASSTPVPDNRQESVFGLALSRVRPNPSTEAPQAVLTLPEDMRVRAAVYDALGRQLGVLVDGVVSAGETELAMPAGLPPGTYVLRVQVGAGGEEALMFTVIR